MYWHAEKFIQINLRPVRPLGEKAVAPHSSTLAWKFPWMEEPGGLQSMGSLRVGHDWETSLHFSLLCMGEGNGNPLQCSCLENPRDGEAWWASVYGVAQSRTRLKWLSSSSSKASVILLQPPNFQIFSTADELSSWKQVWKLETEYPWVPLNMNILQGFALTLNFLLSLDWSEWLALAHCQVCCKSWIKIYCKKSSSLIIVKSIKIQPPGVNKTCKTVGFCQVQWCSFSLCEQINIVFGYIFFFWLWFQGKKCNPLTDPLNTKYKSSHQLPPLPMTIPCFPTLLRIWVSF